MCSLIFLLLRNWNTIQQGPGIISKYLPLKNSYTYWLRLSVKHSSKNFKRYDTLWGYCFVVVVVVFFFFGAPFSSKKIYVIFILFIKYSICEGPLIFLHVNLARSVISYKISQARLYSVRCNLQLYSKRLPLNYDWYICLVRDCHFFHTRVGQVLFTTWSRSTQFLMFLFSSLIVDLFSWISFESFKSSLVYIGFLIQNPYSLWKWKNRQ